MSQFTICHTPHGLSSCPKRRGDEAKAGFGIAEATNEHKETKRNGTQMMPPFQDRRIPMGGVSPQNPPFS